MFITHTLMFFLVLLLVSALVSPFSKKFNIPYPMLLVIIGFTGSEIITRVLHIDTGIHWESFDELIFFGLIPALIFSEALTLDFKSMRNNLVAILCLAIPLMLLAAVITASLIFIGIDHPAGFPWIAALLTGALLSATDPSAVIALLKQFGAPERLQIMLEGESLFNDATAIVLFGFILALAVSGNPESMTWASGVVKFAKVFLGGIIIGSIVGFVFSKLLHIIESTDIQILLSVICAYAVFIFAERYLHLSGVMAVLTAGLIIGHQLEHCDENKHQEIQTVWGFASHFSEILIFLMAGITITFGMFSSQWLAMVIAIAAVVIARAIVVFIPLALICRIPGQEKLPLKFQTIMVWGGVRGTVTLALALSLPLKLDYWYTIQSMAYGVVVYTLFVQATTIGPLMKILKIEKQG